MELLLKREAKGTLWQWIAWRSGAFVATAALIAAWSLRAADNRGLAAYYFLTQDAAVLMIGGVALVLSGFVAWHGPGVGALSKAQAAMLILLVAVVAYAGSYLVMDRYPLARDEQMADFATSYFRHGYLGMAVPTDLRSVAEAMLPQWSDTYLPGGYWASAYLPVHSLLRLAAGWAGDPWLSGPTLLAIGSAALWDAAHRIFPDDKQAATVTLVLALTSTQVVANAMTPYAMTAHFALNALWLACFLRGGRWGHGTAVVIGLAAMGLHQWHFQIIFVAGFIVWLWLVGRRSLALLYAGASLGGILIWGVLYPLIVEMVLALPSDTSKSLPLIESLLAKFRRLAEPEPVTSLARFAAWQNVMLLPLAALGLSAMRNADGKPTMLLGCAISCGLGLATLTYQGHGYGYRYLHGLIPCFCLLAAAGWSRLGTVSGRPMAAGLLAASSALAWLVTGPVLLGRSHAFVAPYASAYRAVRAAPADVVIVDSAAGVYLRDIVRFDAPMQRPLILDLAFLSAAQIDRLCAHRRVMLFDHRQVAALGIPTRSEIITPREETAALLRRLQRTGCANPVPLG